MVNDTFYLVSIHVGKQLDHLKFVSLCDSKEGIHDACFVIAYCSTIYDVKSEDGK